jgi:uncharacterized protein YcaQ
LRTEDSIDRDPTSPARPGGIGYPPRMHQIIDIRTARRLALARAGLLKPEWTGFPTRPGRGEKRQREAAHAVIDRFGYLQLDTVSVAGARSHALVLLSRLGGFQRTLGEQLLEPGEPLFEYWGHEACWMPIELYPVFAFRRRGFLKSRWWLRAMDGHKHLGREVLKRIRDDGPIRSSDLDGKGKGGWWGHKPAKRVVVALWTSGALAIRERSKFQRTFDLSERVIPERFLSEKVSRSEGIRLLVHRALGGHGWATTGTLAQTWRFTGIRPDLEKALRQLVSAGSVVPCSLETGDRVIPGWIRPEDLDLAERLRGIRPGNRNGVLLSPFDPVLWDRKRVAQLFGFDQVLEIFKPAPQRKYGYFCLPVLAGERLIARVDLKADRARGRLTVLSRRFESTNSAIPGDGDREPYEHALQRYADAVELVVK